MKTFQFTAALLISILFSFSFGSYAQNWSFHFSDSVDFNQVIFPDQNTGYIFGDDGIVYKSTDQGTNWNLLNLGASALDYRLEKSYFFDANHGYATGRHNSLNAVVVKTTDGGVSWTSFTNFSDRLNGISFASQTTGIVVGKNGIWYKTSNSGNTWVAQPAFTSEDINDIHFMNSMDVIAVCDGGDVYRSIDGGNTWQIKNTGTLEDLSSIYFLNSNIGYVSASGGVIIKTQDGGNNWSVLNTGVLFDLEDVHFVNSSNGYAVGLSNQVLHTMDGGSTWQINATSALSDIMSIVFVTNSLGYFVTHDGEVFVHQMTTSLPIQESRKLTAVVSPNPVLDTSILLIEDNNQSTYSVELYDIIGNRIFEMDHISNRRIEIKSQELNSGVYMYKIINANNEAYCGKFSVN